MIVLLRVLSTCSNEQRQHVQLDKRYPSKLILAYTGGYLSEYPRGVMESANPELAPYHSQSE